MAPKVYMVGNTHFDPVWLWTWDEGMASIRSTFRAALARMDEEEQFCYSFSCPPVFQWIEKTEPLLFEEIRRRVSEGRWRIDEGMWLQPDCFSASGESYARQCLYGQTYLYRTFGRYSDTAFNADCFGCPETLPQLLVKSKMPYAVFGRPDEKDLPLGEPLFLWTSPDGSTVLSCRIKESWSPWSYDIGPDIDRALKYGDETGRDTLLVFGVTDHGGAPTKHDIAVILEKQRESGGRVLFSGTTEYFAAQEKRETPPETVREIPIRHFGVFADLPAVKKENRMIEDLLFSAEKISVLDFLENGRTPPLALLQRGWEDVLFNQFHDILGGSSVRDAYTDAFRRWGRAGTDAGEYLHTTLQRMTRDIDLSFARVPAGEPEGENAPAPWCLVVWNLHPFPVSCPVEAEVQWMWEFGAYEGDITLTDEEGNEYPCQVIQARETIPGFRSRFVFFADLPAFGYRTYRVCRRKAVSALPGVKPTAQLCGESTPAENGAQPSSVCGAVLDNGIIRAEIDPRTGGISSVWDCRTGKRLLSEALCPLVRKDESDVWAFNFEGYGARENFTVRSVRVLEAGEVRSRVHVTADHGHSVLDADYLLYRGERAVEMRYRLFWQEPQCTCRLRIASCAEKPAVIAAVPFGESVRHADGRDMPMGAHLFFGDEEYPLTVCADGIFSYAAEGNAAELNIVRSPIYGDLRMGPLGEGDYEYLGHGRIEGKLRLDLTSGKTAAEKQNAADAFRTLPVIVDEAPHDGTKPVRMSFFSLSDTENAVLLSACKPAEDGSGDCILRLENRSKQETEASFCLAGRCVSGIRFSPYEIKTLRMGDTVREVNILEE